jgi:hypothetical protein
MTTPIYGLAAEFDTAEGMATAAEHAYEAGYRMMDGYSPFPVEEAIEAMHLEENTGVPGFVLVGGLSGAFAGFLLQWIGSQFDYPLNVGGRPLFSWPAFIPITFEMGVLLASFSAVLALLLLNGLPRPYHPIFNAPNFERTSADRFFFCIEAKDPQFDLAETRAFLEQQQPLRVSEVEQ